MLEQTPGIRTGGDHETRAVVHIIFDVHCPYCAELYTRLKNERPELGIRWVPIAYFKENSATVAAAILRTGNPEASLEKNFLEYDYERRQGGFKPPPGREFRLGQANKLLQEHWMEWGGFTPMVIVQTRNGGVLQAMGSSEGFLDPLLGRAGAPQRTDP